MHAGRFRDLVKHVEHFRHGLVFDFLLVTQGPEDLRGELGAVGRGVDNHGHVSVVDQICYEFGNGCVWIQQITYREQNAVI